ncbi:hypothetical protein VNO78_14910 [Psophocarpus tetragonolobus]|uniref:Uncharacterized protein n=1 Tax=Psophocarpus tetragonolobus TaxID=3891 RepID=A0AAN9SD18_PSOTE
MRGKGERERATMGGVERIRRKEEETEPRTRSLSSKSFLFCCKIGFLWITIYSLQHKQARQPPTPMMSLSS